ncbi:hypothetical protein BGX34_003249 [Mortierella sp. NVP85]|nr:hypothetical protein BGX34_003249 [Mortierella sp. NVP85]
MADQQQESSAHSPLFQNRQQRQSNTPRHHTQFISSAPLPNQRQLFQDTSRARRVFHQMNGGDGGHSTGTSYGAINSNSMRINTTGPNSVAQQAGFVSPGPGTPKPKQVPLRTTKVSQKLVLLPEEDEEAEEEHTDYPEGPFSDTEQDLFRDESDYRNRRRGLHGRVATHSELLTKEQRHAKGLARVVAYCTADGYDIERLSAFLKANHEVHPRGYDEALYVAYHFPLLPGKSTRYKSGPPVRSPGGGSVLDKQLERYEENTRDEFSRSLERENEDRRHLHSQGSGRKLKNRRRSTSRSSRRTQTDSVGLSVPTGEAESSSGQSFTTAQGEPQDYFTDVKQDVKQDLVVKSPTEMHTASMDEIHLPAQNPVTAPFMGGEVFFYDYGVTVFWNMTEEQEAWILNDISQFEVKRLAPDDVQTEEFHFEYAGYAASPRIYNDMITLRGGNHMIKLTISHAISQSVKLALYECQMDDTIDNTKIIPIQLAQTGKLNYSRMQITKISGHLFQLRMHVDLVSNVLDTPEIFWSEPQLQPLYDAIRGYLEISQRAKVLSDRCLVISDLLTMLRDDITSNNMNYITWIIIILIVIAVIVAAGEIVVKYLSHFGSSG